MKNKTKRYFIHALPGPKQWEFLEAIYRFKSVYRREHFTNADMIAFCGIDRHRTENFVRQLEEKRMIKRVKRSQATFWATTAFGDAVYKHLNILQNLERGR